MSLCEMNIDCLECKARGMCLSYALFKYNQGRADAIKKVLEELEKEREDILYSNDYESEIINYCIDNFDRAIEIVERQLKEQIAESLVGDP